MSLAWRKPKYYKDAAKHIWLDDERKVWLVEIPNKGTSMFLYHYPDPNGPWECESNGVWLKSHMNGLLYTTVCMCNVIIPSKIQRKLSFMVAARNKVISLGG